MNKKEITPPHIFHIYFSICAIAIIFLSVISYFNFKQNNKIAYVDISILKDNYAGIKESQEILNKKALTWHTSMDSLSWALDGKEKEEEKKVIRNNKDVNMLVTHIANDYKYEKKYFNVVINNRIKKEEEKIRSKLENDLYKFLKKYRKDKGYEIIITSDKELKAVYAKKPIDITSDVLNKMNQEFLN